MVETTRQGTITRAERQAFARRRLLLPVALLMAVLALYAGLLLLILSLPTALGALLTVPCGMAIGMLFNIGHDACHNAYTASTRLNQVIGRIALLPALHSFSLWDLAHNRTHHRYNNIRGIDYVWEPMTQETYRAAGLPRRALYRLCRTPAGVGLYYLVQIWAPRLALPLPGYIDRMRTAYAADGALVVAFLLLQIWGVIALGAMFGKPAWQSLLLGAAIPFLVWNGFMSFVIFLHHTHPSVRWYPSIAAWRADRGALQGTTRVRFPWPFGPLVLSIMEHNAHHEAPGVPLYNLAQMQRMLEEQSPLVTWNFSRRAYLRICRRCKLYDYDAGRWVAFDGQAA
jgi:omega-6 fatty acid desaturase (delta-12 desaturase)